jgi:dephospho-CoA kinase
MIVLGIVGSPAGGKSTVAKYLQELGATWINADLIARDVLEQADVQAQVLAHFGPEIAGKDGRIDRSLLADRVFGDDDAKSAGLSYLESLIHPRTRQMITAQLRNLRRQKAEVAILDVPLLFKSGWDKSCDEIWCVDSDRNLRSMRVRGRGWDDDELRDREANQLDIEEKKRLSTTVILNNGTLEQLFETIDRLWSSLLQRHGREIEDLHCGE